MSISGVRQFLSFPALRVVKKVKAIEGVEMRAERPIAECHVTPRRGYLFKLNVPASKLFDQGTG